MNESHDPEDKFDQMLQGSLEQTYKAIEEGDYQEYDGVVGEPPSWVPEWAISYFEGYRDRLLLDRGYKVSELLQYIDLFRLKYLDAEKRCPDGIELNVSDFDCPPTYPNGQHVDKHCFLDEIGFLSRLKWCVDQGEKDGLAELSGENALMSISWRENQSKFGAIRAKMLHEERESEWKKWKEEKNRLIKINPHLAMNKSELARKIIENLDLDESVNTVRHRI